MTVDWDWWLLLSWVDWLIVDWGWLIWSRCCNDWLWLICEEDNEERTDRLIWLLSIELWISFLGFGIGIIWDENDSSGTTSDTIPKGEFKFNGGGLWRSFLGSELSCWDSGTKLPEERIGSEER